MKTLVIDTYDPDVQLSLSRGRLEITLPDHMLADVLTPLHKKIEALNGDVDIYKARLNAIIRAVNNADGE